MKGYRHGSLAVTHNVQTLFADEPALESLDRLAWAQFVRELEFHVYSKPNIYVVFQYTFTQDRHQRTHIKQTVNLVQVSKIFENIVIRQANHAQRALLSNLKVRLEKNSLH